jgi:hypothetical protein
MGGHKTCVECEAIARELEEAYSEAWASSDQRTRDAAAAVYRLKGGTAEDAERAEETGARAWVEHIPALIEGPFEEPLRVNRALYRKLMHEARTGHRMAYPSAR